MVELPEDRAGVVVGHVVVVAGVDHPGVRMLSLRISDHVLHDGCLLHGVNLLWVGTSVSGRCGQDGCRGA